MNITVNKSTLNYLSDEKALHREIIVFFNSVIDSEFEKDEINCNLIDECVNAIDELENEDTNIISFENVKKQKRALSNATKGIIAAALAVILGLSAAYKTSPAFAKEVNSLFHSILSALEAVSNNNEPIENLSSIYATAPDSTAIKVSSPDDIRNNEIIVTAVYSDGKKKNIPITDCTVTKTIEKTNGNSFLLITVSYGGNACTIAYEMEELK